MKKIVSRYKRRKTEKRKQIIVSVILIGILFVSTVGFAFQGSNNSSDEQDSIKYNGIEFIENNGYWLTEIQGVSFIFRYNPEQIENIHSDVRLLNTYYNKVLYLNSNNSEAESEIYTNLGQFVTRIQQACLEGEECLYENAPVKTCEDDFIIIMEAEENEIISDGNCVYIQGKQENLLKLSDEFLFKTLGIY